MLQRRRLKLILRPLLTHCSWAQKGSLDVAVPLLVPGVSSSLSLLAQFREAVGFLAVGRRCFCWRRLQPGGGSRVGDSRGEESLINGDK